MHRSRRLRLVWGCTWLVCGAAPASGAVTGSIEGTTLTITGDGADDAIALSVSADTTTLYVDTNADGNPNLSFDRSAFDTTVVDAGAGNDTVTAVGSNTIDDHIAMNGEAGNDRLLGGNGGEPIDGGDGDDYLDGNQGNDALTGGAGADAFNWDPGDATDTLDGGPGADTFFMNGANVNEQMSIVAVAPGHVLLTRDVANISHDITGVETIDVRMLGGTDTYTGGDGVAALVSSIVVDGGALADTLTGGDANETLIGGPDADTVQGGGGDDTFPFSVLDTPDPVDGGAGSDVLAVSGLDSGETFTVDAPGPGQASVTRALAATFTGTNLERVRIDALGGNDSVALTPSAAGALTADLRGGDGNDHLTGGNGNDRLFGDLGDDTLTGLGGADEFHCAGPTDVLDATVEDVVAADCLPPPAPPPPPQQPPVVLPDLTPPALTLTGLPKTIKRGTLLKRGLSFTVRSDEAASLEADLLARARRASLSAAKPNLTVAHATLPLSANPRRVRLKPAKRLVGKARRFTLTVRITATDANRNRRTVSRAIKVR